MRGGLPSKILWLCLLLPLSVRSSEELKAETLYIPTQLYTVSYAFYYGAMSSFIACNNIIDFNTSMSLPMLAGVMRFIGSIGIDYLNSCKPLLFYLSK